MDMKKLITIGLGIGLFLSAMSSQVDAASKWKVQCAQGSLEKVSDYEFRCVVTESTKLDYHTGTCQSPLQLTQYAYAGLPYACVQFQRGGQVTVDKYGCQSGYSANSKATNQNQTCIKPIPASQTYQSPYWQEI